VRGGHGRRAPSPSNEHGGLPPDGRQSL
jgi:hypothetical protein